MAAFIAGPDDYSLLAIDNLGVEQNTKYTMGQKSDFVISAHIFSHITFHMLSSRLFAKFILLQCSHLSL